VVEFVGGLRGGGQKRMRNNRIGNRWRCLRGFFHISYSRILGY
jgi:hypothetical protein